MRGRDPLERAPRALVECVLGLRARDHVPALLHEDLFEDGVARRGTPAEFTFFPVAEEHLAQIGLLDRLQPELRRERRRGLVRALQRGDVDRRNRLVLQAFAEQRRLLLADGVEGRIAVTVAQRERSIGVRGCRLAVAHEQDRRRARRGREPVLAKAFGRDVGIGRPHGREVSAR